MNQLKKFLKNLEVGWMPLDQIATLYGGLTGKKKQDFEDGDAWFIQYKNIFSNIEVDFNNLQSVRVGESEKQNEVQYGDVLFTGSSESVDEVGFSSVVTSKLNRKVYLNSFSFGVRFNEDIAILPEYSKYLFRSTVLRKQIRKSGNGVTRINISKRLFKKIQIPIPYPKDPEKSLALQQEIVRILDTFTELTVELTVELTAELTARRKQYEYYREQLLTFKEGEVEWKMLGEVTEIGTGKHDTKDAIENGKHVFYARGKKPLRLNSYDFEETAIITAGDGAGVGKVFHYVEGKYALHQRAYRVAPQPGLNPRFAYHYILANFYNYIMKASVSSSVTSLRRPMFTKFPIPIPDPDTQIKLVSLLDKFDTLINSITEGLPHEIELRQQQYEYYRDLLLSFQWAEKEGVS